MTATVSGLQSLSQTDDVTAQSALSADSQPGALTPR